MNIMQYPCDIMAFLSDTVPQLIVYW